MSLPIDQSAQPTSDQALAMRIRGFVRALLNDGGAPASISYALAFVATELGLAVANDPMRVFPVVLGAVSQAASARADEMYGEAPEVAPESLVPGNATVH
jgi:hypothetical protein